MAQWTNDHGPVNGIEVLSLVQVMEYSVAKKGCGNESIFVWWLQSVSHKKDRILLMAKAWHWA
jgi:hypothetical protein